MFKSYIFIIQYILEGDVASAIGSEKHGVLTNDLVPLVDVVCAGEQHAAADHLAHDAAHRPDVHVLRVPHAQDYLIITCDFRNTY